MLRNAVFYPTKRHDRIAGTIPIYGIYVIARLGIYSKLFRDFEIVWET